MKLLFVVDVHGSGAALSWVGKRAGGFDAVVVGGDLAGRGEEGFAMKFLEAALACPRVYFVPGNMDAPDTPVPAGVVRLHGSRAELGGRAIGGLGGSNRTPFGTPFELDDDSARSTLAKVGRVDILVSHCPPSGTECDLAGGDHIGSGPVREYVLREGPALVLSGHVHDSRAIAALGQARVVNPGPLMRGNYAVVELGEKVGVELKSENMQN